MVELRLAKKALASCRISLARCSSLTSRSRSLTCCASLVCDAFTHPGVDFCALDPVQQWLRHAANLGRDRFQGSP